MRLVEYKICRIAGQSTLLLGALFVIGLGQSTPLEAQSVSNSVGGITTTPTRASAASIFWNPATLGALQGSSFETNISLLGGWLIYDRSGRDPSTGGLFDSAEVGVIAPSPFFAVASDFGSARWRFGYSTYFPSGALASYPEKGSQRYELISGFYIPWHHQWTVAFNPTPEWSLAAGFIYSLGFFRTEFDTDFSGVLSQMMEGAEVQKESASLASRTKIPFTMAHGFSGNFGVLYRPNVQWSVGVAFGLPFTHSFSQQVQMQRPGFFNSLSTSLTGLGIDESFQHRATVKFESPAFLSAGIRFQPYGYWVGEYYGRYVFSSQVDFTTVRINQSSVQILDNAYMPGAKADDSWVLGTVQTFDLWRPVQAGLVGVYSTSGVPEQTVSPSRIGFNIFTLGTFARYRWTPRLRMSFEYAHSFIEKRRVDDAQNPSSTVNLYEKPLGNGEYRAGMDRFGMNIAYDF